MSMFRSAVCDGMLLSAPNDFEQGGPWCCESCPSGQIFAVGWMNLNKSSEAFRTFSIEKVYICIYFRFANSIESATTGLTDSTDLRVISLLKFCESMLERGCFAFASRICRHQ